MPTEAEVRQVLEDSKTRQSDAVNLLQRSLHCNSLRRAWPAAILSLGAIGTDFETEDFLVTYLKSHQPPVPVAKASTTTLHHELVHWMSQAKLTVPGALASISRRRRGIPDRPLAGGQESPQADKALDLLTKIASEREVALAFVAATGVKGEECEIQLLALRLAAIQALAAIPRGRGLEVAGRLAEIEAKNVDSPSIRAEVARVRELVEK